MKLFTKSFSIFGKNLITDKRIKQIMKLGIKSSFIFCLLSTTFLFTYIFFKHPFLFYAGISLLQSGLFFIATFIICAYSFSKIINEF